MDNERYLIIGGTEKAGTTSLYEYFCSHPQVNPSIKKETDYLRRDSVNVREYRSCFEIRSKEKNFFEASPGYLSRYQDVVNSLKKLNIDTRFVFVIRDPIERLVSSFRFHKSKLYIPEYLNINSYIDMCLDYENGVLTLDASIFDNSWFLEVLSAGRYEVALGEMKTIIDEPLIIDFSDLKKNMSNVVKLICLHFQIDEKYFNNFEFHTANQTISIKNAKIHRFGMIINNKFEKFFRRNPKLKQQLLNIYKKINGKKSIEEEIDEEHMEILKSYYARTYSQMNDMYEARNKKALDWQNFDER